MTAFPAPDDLSAEARIGLAGENFTYALYANNPALYDYLVEDCGFFTEEDDHEGTLTPTPALLGMDYDTYCDVSNAGQPRHRDNTAGPLTERAYPELGGIILSTFGCTGCAEVYPCSTVMPNLPGRDVSARPESGSLADRVGFFAQAISSRTSITHTEARGLAQQVMESPGRAALIEAYARLVESEIDRVVAAGATRTD